MPRSPEELVPSRPAFVCPAAVLAAGATAGILVATGRSATEFCIAVLAMAFAAFYRRKATDIFLLACVTAIFFAFSLRLSPTPMQPGERTVEGVCTAVRMYPASCNVLVEEPNSEVIRLNIIDVSTEVRPGDVLRFKGEVSPPFRYASVPGMRMEEMTDRADRVSGTITLPAQDVEIVGRDNSLRYRLMQLRSDLCDDISSMPLSPQTSQLLATCLLGERNIEPAIRDSFRLAGLSHLLCVSGFHVAFIAAIILLLLRPVSYVKPWFPVRYIIVAVIVWLYTALVGFGSSAVRAAVMISLFAISGVVQLKPQPLNTLCVAYAAVLLFDPFQIYSAGFQLSFSAVAGLIVLTPRLNPVPARHKIAHKATELFLTPLAAILGTLPVSAVWFGRIYALAIPANAIAVAVFPVFMTLGLVAFLLFMAGIPVEWLCRVEDWVYAFLRSIADIAASGSELLPFELSRNPVAVAAIVGTLISLCIGLYSPARRRLAAAGGVACVLLCAGCSAVPVRPHLIVDDSRRGPVVAAVSSRGADVYTATGSMAPALDRYCARTAPTVRRFNLAPGQALRLGGHTLAVIDKKTPHAPAVDILVVARGGGVDPSAALALPRRCVLLGSRLRPAERRRWAEACARAGVPCVDLRHQAHYIEAVQK